MEITGIMKKELENEINKKFIDELIKINDMTTFDSEPYIKYFNPKQILKLENKQQKLMIEYNQSQKIVNELYDKYNINIIGDIEKINNKKDKKIIKKNLKLKEKINLIQQSILSNNVFIFSKKFECPISNFIFKMKNNKIYIYDNRLNHTYLTTGNNIFFSTNADELINSKYETAIAFAFPDLIYKIK